MFLALHPIPSVWDVLLALGALALVFLAIPAAIGLMMHRRRGGKDKS